jgi:hypothetical protein
VALTGLPVNLVLLGFLLILSSEFEVHREFEIVCQSAGLHEQETKYDRDCSGMSADVSDDFDTTSLESWVLGL